MLKPGDIHPLHRGGYPDFPRYIRPRRHSGAELSRMVGDPDAAFVRDDSYCADLEKWLDRPGKRFGFHPRVPLWEVAVMMLVTFAIGFAAFSL